MATQAAPEASKTLKGKFNCFPFKFLFQGQNAEQQQQQVKEVAVRQQQQAMKPPASETATDSYGGSSSVMSVDNGEDEQKFAENGDAMSVCQGQSTVPPPGSRLICGYEILDTLGKGMSGKVKRGLNRAQRRSVALKIIDKVHTPRRVLMMLNTEIEAMRTLNAHPNILSLLHYDMNAVYPRKRGGSRDVVLLALELAEGGELFDFMMYTGAFSEVLAKSVFKQLASALAFCHARGIYHRDIKPENLLLDADFQLKVADFGLAAMKANPDDLLKTECGTRSYMAPEVLARQQYEGAKADCWSSGVVLFIMLSGNPPFQMARPGDWWFNQFNEGRPDRFWKSHKRYSPHFPDAAQDLLTRVFTPNPAQRPTVADLLKDPWLQTATLSPEEIKAELAARKAKIIREKEVEKERAKKKKAAGQYGAKAGKEIDPDKVKHRSVAGVNGEVVTVELPVEEEPAPVAGSDALDNLTNLYTAEGPAYISHRVLEALEMMNGRMTSKSPYHLRAVVPVEGGNQVELDVKIFSVPDEGIQAITVTRHQGDPLAFQRAFRDLRAATVDLHGDDEEEDGGKGATPTGPVPLDADDVEVEVPAVRREPSEQALEEDVGMI